MSDAYVSDNLAELSRLLLTLIVNNDDYLLSPARFFSRSFLAFSNGRVSLCKLLLRITNHGK